MSMRPAQSYHLDPTAIRPERHRLRQQSQRIRSSVSAGPAIATLQRCSRTNQVRTIMDQIPQFRRPCSASADVSSSSSSTDSAEQRDVGNNLANTKLEKIMHTKHQVIKCAREQMIKLVNNDLLPASRGDLPGGCALQTKINRSPIGYDLERQRSLCEQICQEDDTLECPRLLSDKGKYVFTDRKPSETHADDGRSLNTKKHFREHKFGEEKHSDGTHYSLINRRFTRKSNKFFVPFTNNDIGEEPKPKHDKYADSILSRQSETKEDCDQLKGFNELEPQRVIKPPDSATNQPTVKTFYENPNLKGPSGSMLPILTESKSDDGLLSRSTNTSPVFKISQSTNTIQETVQQPSLAVGKDETSRNQSCHRPFLIIQPILFVLAMFTVSMTGAYVGVMVASAGCAGYSDMECEPSILQWLFSPRRHIRAF